MSAVAPLRACRDCLARGWLMSRLAGHLDRSGPRTVALLELDDASLIAAAAGSAAAAVARELEAFDADGARTEVARAGLEAICRCEAGYPRALRAAAAPPAVLYVAGGLDRALELLAGGPVAIVGSRRASPYGLEVAQALAADLGRAGLTVVSGLALGVDAAAHRGALAAPGGATVAVLASCPEQPYPARHRALYRRILTGGAVLSELPPGTRGRRWMFPARNRIIAALSAMTIVTEARFGSGALLTARAAAGLGRPVGAVPGPITSPLSAGPHELLRGGAVLVRGAQDVLDAVFGVGVRRAAASARSRRAAALEPPLAALLEGLAEGRETAAALRMAGLSTERALAALASLELAGLVRRDPGGRYRVPP